MIGFVRTFKNTVTAPTYPRQAYVVDVDNMVIRRITAVAEERVFPDSDLTVTVSAKGNRYLSVYDSKAEAYAVLGRTNVIVRKTM